MNNDLEQLIKIKKILIKLENILSKNKKWINDSKIKNVIKNEHKNKNIILNNNLFNNILYYENKIQELEKNKLNLENKIINLEQNNIKEENINDEYYKLLENEFLKSLEFNNNINNKLEKILKN